MFGIRDRILKKKIQIENKLLLYWMLALMSKYQVKTDQWKSYVPVESTWSSAMEEEARILNKSKKVLERRYAATAKK